MVKGKYGSKEIAVEDVFSTLIYLQDKYHEYSQHYDSSAELLTFVL
jgi:hypothetical protein